MLRPSLLLLALAACALAASIPAAKEEASSTVAAAAPAAATTATPAPKSAAPAPKAITTKTTATKAQPLYTSKFDNVNLDQILASDRLLNNYHKCLMERGPCTPDAAELRRLLPDALETDCSKCTPKQREGSEKVIEHMIKNKPNQWKELQTKYDPNGNYKSKYHHLAEERGLKV